MPLLLAKVCTRSRLETSLRNKARNPWLVKFETASKCTDFVARHSSTQLHISFVSFVIATLGSAQHDGTSIVQATGKKEVKGIYSKSGQITHDLIQHFCGKSSAGHEILVDLLGQDSNVRD